MKTPSSVPVGLIVLLGCLRAVLAADVLDTSLRLRLNFDSAPVNNVIADSSPSGAHSGINSNAIWTASEDGRTGVMDFKAPVDNRITVPASPTLNSTVGTISFWIKAPVNTGPGEYAAMLFDRRTQQGDVITLTDEGTIFVQARSGGANVNAFAATKVINDDQWHHVAYVYDQSATGSIAIYVDGVLDATQANNSAWAWPLNQPLEIGSSHDPYWRRFGGWMDDVQIHNRMLSETELAATAAGNPVLDSSLVLRLNFDAAPAGDIVIDSSPSNNSGTNKGATWLSTESGHNGVMRFSLPVLTGITVPPDPDFDVTSGTIAFWMKSTGNVGPGDFASMIFDRRTSVGDVITMKDDGTIFVQAQGAARVNSFATTGRVNDGQWHHVAYVFDQSAEGSITINIDGTVSGSQKNSGEWSWPSDQQLELGSSHDSYWFRFNGALDDFRFYNRPLSAAEIGDIGVAPRLRFDLQPASQTVFAGDDVVFTAAANMPASYQWKFGEVLLAGSTSTNLILTNVQPASAGAYTVIATNVSGVVTSTPAILTINPRPTLAASLIARYNFDAAPVNNVIVDSTQGSQHPGTNLFATWMPSVNGREGVMQFASADPGSQIVILPDAEFNSSKGAIAFWLKSAGNGETGEFGAVLFDRRSNDGDLIVLQDEGTVFVQAYSHGFNINSFSTTKTVNDDQWHHIAYVYDQGPNGSIRIYVDGQLAGSNPNSSPWAWDPAQTIEIGMSNDTYWRRLDGFLDDVQFYNRMLSEAEVLQSMNLSSEPDVSLNVSRNGTQLTISWSATGFVLEQNPTLGNAAGWAPVPGGSTSPFAVPLPTTGNNFYRLRKP